MRILSLMRKFIALLVFPSGIVIASILVAMTWLGFVKVLKLKKDASSLSSPPPINEREGEVRFFEVIDPAEESVVVVPSWASLDGFRLTPTQQQI